MMPIRDTLRPIMATIWKTRPTGDAMRGSRRVSNVNELADAVREAHDLEGWVLVNFEAKRQPGRGRMELDARWVRPAAWGLK